MKYVLFLTTIFLSHFAEAKNYYVSASGNDANAGTSSAPWKSINKVNSAFGSMLAGDSILFKRGETFYGTIRVNKSGASGKPIVISAYGTGAMPIITGMTTITAWSSAGTNLWKSNTLTAKSLMILTVSDALKMKGRYPNSDADSRGGYLYHESFSGTGSITDNQLSSSPNWVGATIVLKPNPWTIGRFPITGHSGGTLTFTGNKTTIRSNYGYFIQDHLSTLDQQYEWMYNASTKQVTMYSTSSPTNVKVSTADTLISVYNRSYITIKGLQLQGAGRDAVLLNTATSVTVDGCNIYVAGETAVAARASKSVIVQNCTITDCYDIAIDLQDINNANGIVKNNVIKRTGADPGIGGASMSGIALTGNGHTVQGNTIDSSGYSGIEFQRGSNLTIKNKVINTYCFVKSDGGGIYTWNNYVSPTTYTNNKIIGNIISNGIGTLNGTPSSIPDADGLFMDDNTSNIEIADNTVFNVVGSGLYVHNNFNMNIQRNTLYNNGVQQVMFNHNLAYVNGSLSPYTTPLRNITFKKNILFSKKSTQKVFIHTTILNDIGSTGTQDSNYFCRPADETKTITAMKTVSGVSSTSTYDLSGWKTAYTPKDVHSTKAAIAVPTTTTTSGGTTTVGSNLVKNGLFLLDILGISIYSPNKNQVVSLDLLSKITGTGSLKVSFPTSVSGTYTSIYTSVGAVSSSKKYRLRFKTVGTTSSGSLRVYLRKLASPYTVLTPSLQYKTYGTSVTSHEFIFSAPATESSAAVFIELNQNSGTTYLDDIELYEITTTTAGTMEDNIRFEYNPTASSKTVSLGAKYTSVEGTVYDGSIVLAPYSSKILIWTSTTTLARPAAQTTAEVTEIVAEERPIAETTVEKLKINCYPNPSPNGFTVMAESKSTENINIAVFTIEGKMVYQTAGSKYNRFTFGNSFMPGTYIVKVMQGTDVQTLKLIKTQ